MPTLLLEIRLAEYQPSRGNWKDVAQFGETIYLADEAVKLAMTSGFHRFISEALALIAEHNAKRFLPVCRGVAPPTITNADRPEKGDEPSDGSP